MKTILIFGELQHIRVAVAAARVFEVHEIIFDGNDAPVFFQFGKCAGQSTVEINQKLVGAVVDPR